MLRMAQRLPRAALHAAAGRHAGLRRTSAAGLQLPAGTQLFLRLHGKAVGQACRRKTRERFVSHKQLASPMCAQAFPVFFNNGYSDNFSI